MDLLWRILAALSFDCFKSSSSSRSPGKLSSSQAGSSLDGSSSLTGSLSLGPDAMPPPPHCQGCVASEARLKRLSCGHLYCEPCCRHIVNLAFRDIEGLSDYPCPVCKSLSRPGGPAGASSSSSSSLVCLWGPVQEPAAGCWG
ncbi:uncharacterized protein LOC144021863 [Festucalex cinctus]